MATFPTRSSLFVHGHEHDELPPRPCGFRRTLGNPTRTLPAVRRSAGSRLSSTCENWVRCKATDRHHGDGLSQDILHHHLVALEGHLLPPPADCAPGKRSRTVQPIGVTRPQWRRSLLRRQVFLNPTHVAIHHRLVAGILAVRKERILAARRASTSLRARPVFEPHGVT